MSCVTWSMSHTGLGLREGLSIKGGLGRLEVGLTELECGVEL